MSSNPGWVYHHMTEAAKQPYPLLTVAVKYALVGTALTIVLFFVLLFFDKNPLVTNNWVDFLLLPIFIFFSIKEYKKYYNQGTLHFWQGMTVGFFTYCGMAFVVAVFLWGYLSLVSPALVQDYITARTDLIMSSKDNFITQFGEETYRKVLADVQLVRASDIALDDFMKKLLVGLFITSVVSVLMRRLPVTEKT